MFKSSYKTTFAACSIGYITQAIVCNLMPLFFVCFSNIYGFTNIQLGIIVFVTFSVQLIVDALSPIIIRRVGYRFCTVAAPACALVGLVFASVLPNVLKSPFTAILLSVSVSSVGSGLIEVLVSPIVDNMPSSSKAASMSILHSMYCWGCVAVSLVTTGILALIGTEKWYCIPLLWAVIPLVDVIMFMRVEIPDVPDKTKDKNGRKLLTSKIVIVAGVLMFVGAVCELSVAQWASYFAERGLGINKTLGDILGPCMFAVFMGAGRVIYGTVGKKINVYTALWVCGIITAVGYAMCSLSPIPIVSLLGCAVVGFGVSLMWPCTLSCTSAKLTGAGTTLFAFLALSGDFGCAFGPMFTGLVSEIAVKFPFIRETATALSQSPDQTALKFALALHLVLPVIFVILVRKLKKMT